MNTSQHGKVVDQLMFMSGFSSSNPKYFENIHVSLIYWERQGREVGLPQMERARKRRAWKDIYTMLSHGYQLQMPPVPAGTQCSVYWFICCAQGHPGCLPLPTQDISPSRLTEEMGAWESHRDTRRLRQLKICRLHGCRNPVKVLSAWMTGVKTSSKWPSMWKNHSMYFHHQSKGLSRVEGVLRGLDFLFFTWVVTVARRGASQRSGHNEPLKQC